jgi:acyl-CoA reductase-like NAD-dependent aldehyde dehydrogenase
LTSSVGAAKAHPRRPIGPSDLVEIRGILEGNAVDDRDWVTAFDAPDGVPYARVMQASPETVKNAVATAASGFQTWRRVTSVVRSETLWRVAEALDARKDELANVAVLESGKPWRQALNEVDRAAGAFRDFSAFARAASDSAHTQYSKRVIAIEQWEPLGPAAVICTWNFPLQITAIKIASALAAGCSVVVKTSPRAPLGPMCIVEACLAAGVPEPAVAVLHGGAELAAALAGSSGIRVITATGGTRAGVSLMQAAAPNLTKLILELGGKSANIVFDDADIDSAAAGAVAGFVRNQGATCTAATRILVQERIARDFTDALIERLKAVVVGDPWESVDIGATRDAALAVLIEEAVDAACRRGARCLLSGGRVAVRTRRGVYLGPSLIDCVQSDDPLLVTETFGPAATVQTFRTASEAVQLANATPYGLATGVWSADWDQLRGVAEQLDCGTVYFNSYHRIDGNPATTSGRKASGFGAEGGMPGLREFQQVKALHIAASSE